jgi:hypothetical protein
VNEFDIGHGRTLAASSRQSPSPEASIRHSRPKAICTRSTLPVPPIDLRAVLS